LQDCGNRKLTPANTQAPPPMTLHPVNAC
jgi:hypothetical protein